MAKILKPGHGSDHPPAPGTPGKCSYCRCEFELDEKDRPARKEFSGDGIYPGFTVWVMRCPDRHCRREVILDTGGKS